MRHPDFFPPPCHAEHKILHENESFLLVEKPEGLLSVPGRNMKDSLINRVQKTYPSAAIVHRLDLDTSGIMVIPLRKQALSEISKQFRERLLQKTYQAIVYGLVENDEGKIELPIAPDEENRPRQRIDLKKGKPALTHYRVLSRNNKKNQTRLQLKPVTGRSHQLRLHLKAIEHPILGCDLYAHEDAFSAASRLMLHATELSFTHPETGSLVTGQSPVPF